MYRLLASLLVLLALTACGGGGTATDPAAPANPADAPVDAPATEGGDATALDAAANLDAVAQNPIDAPGLRVGVAAPTAAPTPANFAFAPDQPTRLVIPAIEMDRPLVNVGLDSFLVPIVPKHDVGWYHYSARPGGGDNIVLWGHVLRFRDAPDVPAPFARLDEVDVGEPITLFTADGQEHRYTVSDQIWATPDQVEYILPQGNEMITMVSCTGEATIVDDSVQMSHRLITIAVPEA